MTPPDGNYYTGEISVFSRTEDFECSLMRELNRCNALAVSHSGGAFRNSNSEFSLTSIATL